MKKYKHTVGVYGDPESLVQLTKKALYLGWKHGMDHTDPIFLKFYKNGKFAFMNEVQCKDCDYILHLPADLDKVLSLIQEQSDKIMIGGKELIILRDKPSAVASQMKLGETVITVENWELLGQLSREFEVRIGETLITPELIAYIFEQL